MLSNILSAQQPKNIISVTTSSFRHLSPQALEALQTLDQIRNQKGLNNQKIVRRVSSQYYQPPPLSVYGGRSASVFTSSPIKMVVVPENSQLTSMCTSFVQQQLVKGSGVPQISSRKPSVNTDRMISHQNTMGEPTPFFRDTISSDRNRLNQTSLSNYLAKHQLQNQLKTHTQSSNNNCTERLNELLAFKQQVQNDVLIETIISKFDSPLHKDSFKKFSPLNRGTPITTPIVNNTLTSNTKLTTIQNSPVKNDDQLDSQLRNNEERIKIMYGGSQTAKENKSPCADLVKKKKMILNQILSLDNQIKIMQDEETKQKLDPQHKKKLSCSNQKSEILYKQASERQESLKKVYEQNVEQKIIQEMQQCTFVPKLNNNLQITSTFQERMNNWVKQKSSKILLKQELSQEEIMRQCTFSPAGNSSSKQINASGVYQRNQEWQQRLNMKKQKMKCQNSMIQLNNSHKSQNNKSQNKGSSQKPKKYHIDFTQLLKSNNIVQDQKPLFSEKINQKHHTTEMTTTISPRKQRLNNSNQIENVNNKYIQLCQMAQKMKCKFS